MVAFILTLIAIVTIIWAVKKLPGGCQKDCNQGRSCDCFNTRKEN